LKWDRDVLASNARRTPLTSRSARLGYCCSIAALLIVLGGDRLQTAAASGETRTISFHNTHTKEDLTVTYKRNGRYDEEALKKINHFMRDWREDEPTRMDPHLIDLLWEVHNEVGAREPIWVICGYRSPATNSMLRRRSSGVAKFSQHTQGKAIDFYIPGVPLTEIQSAGLRSQRGGVGIYPSTGFVHLDTGSVRHWPRMPEAQLAAVVQRGPLNARFASDAGAGPVRTTQVAQASPEPPSSGPAQLFAKLFGTGGGSRDTEEHEETETVVAKPAPRAGTPTRTTVTVVAPKPVASEPRNETISAKFSDKIAAAVPLPRGRPAPPLAAEVAVAPPAAAKPQPLQVAAATPRAAPKPESYEVASANSQPVRPAQAASLVARASANDIINERGFWQGVPKPEPLEAVSTVARSQPPRPPADIPNTVAEPATTASVWPPEPADQVAPGSTLAYAAQPSTLASRPAPPMGSGTPRTLAVVPSNPDTTTVAVKRSDDRPTYVLPPRGSGANAVRVGDRFNDPWMRAMIVSPSADTFMKTTLFGVPDYRHLGPYLLKPASAVKMTFSEDPLAGITSERFSGSAVVFAPIVSFTRTAALR
jgi:uncharacterized protein YcbK (DUF882 family)